MIRSERSQKAEDILRVDQAEPTPADPLIPNLSSVSKDSELPTAGEADPKRRRRIGKAGIKKEARGDSEGASIDVFGSRSTNLSPADQKNVEFQNATWFQSTPLDIQDCSIVRKCGINDMVLLYITLVSDRAIPAGFLAEFLSLEHPLKLSSKRSMNLAVGISDAEAERLLMLKKKQRDMQILNSSAASDQLVLATELKPRRFRSKWQRIVYEGPTARKDLDNAERSRWVASLGDLLRHTDTPMGRLMTRKPLEHSVTGFGTQSWYFALSGTVDKENSSSGSRLRTKLRFRCTGSNLLSFFKFDSPNLVFGDL